MLFGLKHVPKTFERAMGVILAALKWQIILVHTDDVIIVSASPLDYKGHFETFLKLIEASGMTLKFKKCLF